MVSARLEAVKVVCAQPCAETKMVEHVAGLVEEKALRIAGQLNNQKG